MKTDSELHVVHVRIPPYHPSIFERMYIGEYLQEEQKEIERSAQELPDEQVGRIKAAGVAQAHLRIGRSNIEITALAEEIGRA